MIPTAGRSAALLIVLLTLMPAPTSAGVRTAVAGDCFHAHVKPDEIIFACADAGWYVDHLRWSSWRLDSARGYGTFHINDCVPNCAAGTFHTRGGRIVLSGRHSCAGGVQVFTHAAITYWRPWHHTTEFRTKLFCPFH